MTSRIETTFIIHPTFECNADCLHCGVAHLRSKYKRFLPQEVGVRAIFRCIEFLKRIHDSNNFLLVLVFHGGEPMLVGVNYYEKFLNVLDSEIKKNKDDISYTVSFQSNLILYNDNWKNFLKKHNGKVSSSYDFYANFRVFRENTENEKYFLSWTNKVKKYQDDFGSRLHVITVISRLNKDYIKEIVDYGYYLNLNLKLNPLYDAGNAKNIYNDISISDKEYGEVLINAYRQWQKYKDSMHIEQCKEMEEYVLGICDKMHTKCPYSGICVGYIWGIDPDGNIYNCGNSIQMGRYYLGNFKNGVVMNNFLNAKKDDLDVFSDCFSCGICGGGCKLFRESNTKKYTWCESYKMLFLEIKGFMKEELK
ncbi:MAG: SPASM domain-containing protein [Elusimicrobiota bacterium]|nr:SPASM domain-containing protein [Endomicrobiia bacterium]MDW8166405.1 SPASM domain-containing protein [Elusimicrobiota bacterium]